MKVEDVKDPYGAIEELLLKADRNELLTTYKMPDFSSTT